MVVSDEAYRQAGVDLKSAESIVKIAKKSAASTFRPWLLGGIGSFSAAFEIPEGYKQPVLLCACDGVGTKLKLAFEADDHRTVGIDLVAMSTNDILVNGGRPLVFLDYLATQKILPEQVSQILEGVAEGCIRSDCSLVGGETAEMPGFYVPGEYDLAGFCVGVVEKQHVYPRISSLEDGDVLIGLSSSGLHSNGFSLVRKILTDNQIDLHCAVKELGDDKSILQHLLEPTRIYVKPVLSLLKQLPDAVKAMVHVTGGGFYDNIPRVLSENFVAEIDSSAWPLPPLYQYLQNLGQLNNETLWHTFNCGIGYVLVVSAAQADAVLDSLNDLYKHEPDKADVSIIGKLRSRTVKGEAQVIVR